MNISKNIIAVFLTLLMCLLVTSCDKYEYTDKLQGLGTRVEILEDEILQINREIAALQTIIHTIEKNGYITDFIYNDDGTVTIKINDGRTFTIRNGKDGVDGKDGKEIDDFRIGVAQDGGIWYWTLNGKWILDGDGNKMRASGLDGKDGRDGKDGEDGLDGRDGQDGKNNPAHPAIVPQVRINTVTRHWEISTDGGQTWEDTGVYADGRDGKDGKDGEDGLDGKDGKDGKDGAPDIFADIIVAPDGKSITFILTDGRSFSVPVA